jgi:hypothetical protein
MLLIMWESTTLHMLCSAAYYLELRDPISICLISHDLPISLKLVVGHYKTLTTLLDKGLHQK